MRPTVCLLVVLLTASAASGEPEPQFGLRFGPADARGGESTGEAGSPAEPGQEVEGVTGDSAVSAATSYNSMVLHSEPDRPRYKTVRVKTMKHLVKPMRHPVNYKVHKHVRHETQTLSPTLQVPSNTQQSFGHVDPAVMQNLMKQQPQTFDVPESDEREPSRWRVTSDEGPSTESVFKSQYEPQSDSSTQGQEQNNGFDTKRPIYVPNRVSVQNPSADSSFNVGYSIGFGNGLAQSAKGTVQPPVGMRKGKVLNFPISYQNTPVNVHIDGTNSVWKNMGSGVEMSENLNYKENSYTTQDEPVNSNDYSSGSAVNQPIFYREVFEQSPNSGPSAGRSSFDHDHALQQSNTFDFSNAIDPVTNLPYSVEPSSSFFSKPMTSFPDSFLKQSSPIFGSSSIKQDSLEDSYPSSQSRPSFAKSHIRQEFSTEPQYSQYGSGGENYRYESFSDESKFGKPNFSSNTLAPLRALSSLSINPKSKALESSTHYQIAAKQNYNLKPFGSSSLNHVSGDAFGSNNYGFGGIPVLPPMFDSAVKPAPAGMVQAILVPVNPAAPMPYPVGMPVVSNGFPPFLGHPIGMIRIPEPVAAGSAKEEYEAPPPPPFSPGSHPDSHYPPTFYKSPAKIHSHFSKYTKDGPPESSQYFLQRVPHSHPHREEHPSSRHHPAKFNRGLHEHSSEFKSSPPSSYSSPEHSESSPSYHIQNHPSRPYRGPNMIIVKRA